MKIILHDTSRLIHTHIEFKGAPFDVKFEMREVYGDQGAEKLFKTLGIFQPEPLTLVSAGYVDPAPQRQELTGCGEGPRLTPQRSEF